LNGLTHHLVAHNAQSRASFRTSARASSTVREEIKKDAEAVAATLPPKWAEDVKKELKGQDPSKLVRFTTEGIPIKPIYTEADNPTWNPENPALSGMFIGLLHYHRIVVSTI
jgi:hypothetical protein